MQQDPYQLLPVLWYATTSWNAVIVHLRWLKGICVATWTYFCNSCKYVFMPWSQFWAQTRSILHFFNTINPKMPYISWLNGYRPLTLISVYLDPCSPADRSHGTTSQPVKPSLPWDWYEASCFQPRLLHRHSMNRLVHILPRYFSPSVHHDHQCRDKQQGVDVAVLILYTGR